MTTQKYFTWANSNATVTKKFRVLMSGHIRVLQKAMNIDYDLDGSPDVSMGSVREQYQFIVKVRHTEDEIGYGTKDDLEYFYRLNNPNGTPSPVITMTTHLGVVKNIILVGTFEESALGVMLEGNTAWFNVKTSMIVKT